jgi:hypothetical protein
MLLEAMPGNDVSVQLALSQLAEVVEAEGKAVVGAREGAREGGVGVGEREVGVGEAVGEGEGEVGAGVG